MLQLSCNNIAKATVFYIFNQYFILEPDIKLFLKAIVQSMSIVLIWMMLNAFFGIKIGLMFFDKGFTLWNGVYYIALLVSFGFMLRYLILIWKKVPRFGNVPPKELGEEGSEM